MNGITTTPSSFASTSKVEAGPSPALCSEVLSHCPNAVPIPLARRARTILSESSSNGDGDISQPPRTCSSSPRPSKRLRTSLSPDTHSIRLSPRTHRRLRNTLDSLGVPNLEDALSVLLDSYANVSASSATKTPLRLSHVCDDILIRIFSYTDCFALWVCLLVCRRWYDILDKSGIPEFSALKDRFSRAGLYVVGGVSREDVRISNVGHFHPVLQRWVELEPYITPPMRYHCAVAAYNRCMYMVGGRVVGEDAIRMRDAWMFDVDMLYWKRLPSMPRERSAPAAAIIYPMLYVFGGYDGTQEFDIVDAFDLEKEVWIPDALPRMPHAACEVVAVVAGGCVFVIGGTKRRYGSHETVIDSVQKYCPRKNCWTLCAPLSHPRMCPAAIALSRSTILVAGGSQTRLSTSSPSATLDAVELYNIETDTWEKLRSLPRPRSNATGCLLQLPWRSTPFVALVGGYVLLSYCHRLYFFCSSSLYRFFNSPLSSVDCYDPVLDIWFPLPPLDTPRDACRVVSIV